MATLRRVLILEENTDHLEVLTTLLEDHFLPIDIHTVETIEDCLEFLEQTDYDLIMTGCFIHNTCITERLGHIVQRSHGAPIIVITGSGDENIAAEVIKLGASEYVVKTRKALEEIPALVTKYFKKGRRHITSKTGKKKQSEMANRLLREVDRLIQKARHLSSNSATSIFPNEQHDLESLFAQIQRLRELASKMTRV